MLLNNITSANASAILTVDELFTSGVNLEQFSTDQSLTIDEVVYSESRMGVDGKMVSGFLPSIKNLNIVLEASSPSLPSLSQVAEMMTQNKTVYACTLVITIPSIGKVFTFSNGVLKSGKVFPDNKKMLEPVNFSFQFELFKSSDI